MLLIQYSDDRNCVFKSPWGISETKVEIDRITANRENGTRVFGHRPSESSHDFHYDLGNFSQADNALFKCLKDEGFDLEAKDIVEFRESKKLT